MSKLSFLNGFWGWDDENNCLKFYSRDETNKARATTTVCSTQISTRLKFRNVVDTLEQIKFRRYFQRQCDHGEPNVITLQDIKDVVLFCTDLQDLNAEFIIYLHSPTVDRFLRALIVYFQFYLQVYDLMLKEQKNNERKLWHPSVEVKKNMYKNDLADLRCIVAREYMCIITGIDDMKRFYHLKSKIKISLSDRDRVLFESLMCIAARVVWIALRRKHFSVIDMELNRLLRSRHFNLASRRHTFNEKTSDLKQRKLLQQSPALHEILLKHHDYRILTIGVSEIQPTDERLEYLEAAYMAPEELLPELKVTVGILGLPRNQFNVLLKETTKMLEIPLVQLPPKSTHDDKAMPKKFPKQSYCKYKETERTRTARKRQCKMWKSLVKREDLIEAIMEQSTIKLNESSYVKRSSCSMRKSSIHFRISSEGESLFSF